MSLTTFLISLCLLLTALWLWQVRRVMQSLKSSNKLRHEGEALTFALDLLSEHSGDILFRYDPKGFISNVSQNFERVTGFDVSKDKVNIFEILTDKPSNKTFRSHLGKSWKKGDDKRPLTVEIYNGFGKTMLLEIFETPENDISDELRYIHVVAKDVTTAKETEKDLKDSRNQLELIIKAIPDAMFMIDRDGRYTGFQIKDESKLWYEPSEFVGQKVIDVIPKPLGSFFVKHVDLAFKTGEIQTIEYHFDKEQERSYFEGRLVKLNEDRVLVIARDITAVKLASEELVKAKKAAEEANKAKTAFLATMSHEIRTPLNGVVGMTSLLMDANLNEVQYETLETLKASSDSLLQTINDVLDYSRIESGKLDFKESLFYIKKLVDETLSLIKFEARKKGILLNAVYDDDVPQFIRTDETRLRQILSNLLYNAIKFTEYGSISIQVSCMEQKGDNIRLKFRVQDTGVGIPAEEQAKLFDEFTQVDNSYSRKFTGSGLGLAIVKKLVTLLEGEVSVESEMNKGSIFNFTIKARVASSVPETDDPENSTSLEAEYIAGEHPLKLLLVEDNDINRKLIVIYLERLGCVADIAKDGIEALRMISKNTYEAILLDVSMPKMDGFQVAQAVQKMEHTPLPYIIGISANAFKEDVSKAHEIGMNDYIVKPIYFKDLKERLLKAHSFLQKKTE